MTKYLSNTKVARNRELVIYAEEHRQDETWDQIGKRFKISGSAAHHIYQRDREKYIRKD